MKLTPAKRKRLVKAATDKKGVSQTKLAQKFGVDKSYVQKVLPKEGFKRYKRKKAPDCTEEKEIRQKRCCRKLIRTVLTPSSVKVVMDDESYFTLGHPQIPGNDRFYTKNKKETLSNVKYFEKKKFEPKILVWLAISEDGDSEPFFVPSKGNINGDIYRKECIERRLIPFLQQHHADGDYIFWPDLASSHYAKDTVAPSRGGKYPFCPKKDNPPNKPLL